MTPLPRPEDWTCRVCNASHPQPSAACRRCGANLLLSARLAACARALAEAGLDDEAAALDPGQTGGSTASGASQAV
jgi:hypothetical protein